MFSIIFAVAFFFAFMHAQRTGKAYLWVIVGLMGVVVGLGGAFGLLFAHSMNGLINLAVGGYVSYRAAKALRLIR
ncbi:MAG: hypothetical protein RLZZ324_892 [Candidatus Parcubacteria bacterium]|jgi:hypothetical protein